MGYCMYLRKSRADLEAEQRGELETLARHEAALRDLARREGIRISAVYREIVSGDTIAHRPVMQQLLAEVEQSRWEGVLVMEVERLARGDTIDQGIMARAFRLSGTKIYTPLKRYDPLDEFDEEYFEFGLFMSRREYRTINRRLQRGRRASVLEGRYVGSVPPYGYRRVRVEEGSGYTLEPVEEQAAVVRLVYEWYTESRGPGVTAIAARLDALGIPSPGGGHWSPSGIRDLLSNPVYMGVLRWKRRPVSRQMEEGRQVLTRPRSDGYLTAQGLHPPLVAAETWEKARRRMASPSSKGRPDPAGLKNPLAGLVRCGACGAAMLRKPQKAGKDTLLCPTRGCPTVSAPLEQVEQELLRVLLPLWEGYRPSPRSLPGQDSGRALLGCLEAEARSLERREARLCDLLEQGVYDVETWRRRKEALDRRRQELADRLDALPPLPAAPGTPREEEACPPLPELYSRSGPAERNALLRVLLEQIVYLRTEGGRWSEAGFALHVYPRLLPEEPASGSEADDSREQNTRLLCAP